MKMSLRLLYFCALFFICFGAKAQSKFDIKGTIIDNESGDPLEGTTVQLLSLPDSAFVDGVLANEKGSFKLEKVPFVKGQSEKNKYLIKLSMIGYVTQFINLDLNTKKGKTVELGIMTMLDNAHTLGEAVVTATAAKVQVSGDSLVYNASAYRVPEGSTLEALLKLLPGAQVDENGKITINGKEVT